MYRLIISPEASKDLKQLAYKYKQAIRNMINELKDNPYSGKKLTRDFSGKYSYRIGVYRIIYRINRKDKVLNILSAGHTSTVYK